MTFVLITTVSYKQTVYGNSIIVYVHVWSL